MFETETKKILNTNMAEVPHKNKILTQIERCNIAFSGFAPDPEIINEKMKITSYLKGSQEGRRISLAVLTLLANSESILPIEFFEHLKKENKFINAFTKTKYQEEGQEKTGYKFLSEDPSAQYEGILAIWEFYKELLNAIYSLEDFSDIKLVYKRKKINYQDLEDEDALFGD